MGRYTILKNSQLDIELTTDYQDNGWSFVNGTAVHDDCNQGSIRNTIFVPESGQSYKINITVANLQSGIVRFSMGGYSHEIATNGNHVFSFVTENIEPIEIWSDANVIVSGLAIYEGEQNSKTLLFNEDNNQFVGYRSYDPDMTTKFIDEFISFKNGMLYIHDKSEVRNNFYGEQYPSVISFYANIESEKDKDFFSIVLEGNQPWLVEVEIPTKQGLISQRSRIKPGRFVFEKGSFRADFLRDMNDPRFETELEALMRGAYLVGKYMKITLTNNSAQPVKLVSASVEVGIK